MPLSFPSAANGFQRQHVEALLSSYRHWTGQALLESKDAKALFFASFALVSHGTEADPVFNYGNLTALNLFEMSWEEFTALPSRLSAEAPAQAERERLLKEVSEKGFIEHYQGVRLSRTGKRLKIINATVWNLVDEQQILVGQAAMFSHWKTLV